MSTNKSVSIRTSGLGIFSKLLIRRCAAHCELCDAKRVKLTPFEFPPFSEEPEFSHCLLLCEVCSHQVQKQSLLDSRHWYGLVTSVWSSIPIVRVASVMMLNRLKSDQPWAARMLDQVYLSADEYCWYKAMDACCNE